MLSQQLDTAKSRAIFVCRYMELSDSSKKCNSVLLTIRELGQLVSYNLDLSVFIPSLTNLNKTHA